LAIVRSLTPDDRTNYFVAFSLKRKMVPQVSRSASLLSELGSTDRNVTVMPVQTVDKVAAVVADIMRNIVRPHFWRDRTVIIGGTPHPFTCPIVAPGFAASKPCNEEQRS
jgi:hypothetical protein